MRGYTLLTALLASVLTIANVTAAKIAYFDLPVVGGTAVPAGFVAIGVSFLLTDLISELYGKEAAQTAVNSVLAALVLGWSLIYTAIWLPAAPFYADAAAFRTVMGASGTVVLASILTLVVSQNADVVAFHAIRDRVETRAARNVGSTAASQFLDTALFIGLAFVLLPRLGLGGEAVTISVALGMVGAQYVLKLALALADTPLFYLATALTGRTEGDISAPDTFT